MFHSLTLVHGALAILCVFLIKRFFSRPTGPLLPPGPRPWLGVLALPSGTDREWRTYGKWAETWGEITSVTVFGQPIVVLNSFKAATEMLGRKSTYSDRPTFQMCGELVSCTVHSVATLRFTVKQVGWKRGMALLSYGTPQFRRYRKYFHQLFGSHANISKFYPIEVDQFHKFLKHLLESPERFISHIHL